MSVAEAAARASLRSDGRFCIIVGVVAAVASQAIAEPLGLAGWLVAVIGTGSIAWGVFVHRLSASQRWMTAITAVAGANFMVGMGLAVFALTPGGARLRLFAGGLLALAVLWYAVTQAIIRWNVAARA